MFDKYIYYIMSLNISVLIKSILVYDKCSLMNFVYKLR